MRGRTKRLVPLGLLAVTAGLAAIVWSGAGTAATQAVPGNQQPPTITGTPQVGATLTAREGTWTGNPTTFTYSWRRCDAVAPRSAERLTRRTS
jgi:hypothetical protein